MGFFRKNKYLKPYFLEKASTFQICLTRKSKRYKQAWKVYIKGFKTLKQIVNLHILSILLFHLHIYIYIWNSFYMLKVVACTGMKKIENIWKMGYCDFLYIFCVNMQKWFWFQFRYSKYKEVKKCNTSWSFAYSNVDNISKWFEIVQIKKNRIWHQEAAKRA